MIASLGPGTTFGTECLLPGGVCEYTVRIAEDSLLWVLSRDSYNTYLTVGLFRAFHVDG